MKSLLLLSLLLASSVLAETPRERYERTHRDRGPTVRFGAPPHTANTNSFRFIEYLESTGTQWIDTGILPTPTTRLDLDFVPQNNGVRLFGADDLRGGVTRKFWVAVGGNRMNLQYNASSNGSNITASNGGASILNIRTAISVQGKSITAFGSTQTDSSWTIATDNGCSIGLFAGHSILNDGSVAWRFPSTMRLYSCAIYDGTLVRDFVPVRVGSVGYLLDRVSGQLFGNSGTGDFVLGPDVPLSAPVSLSPAAQRAFLAPRTDAPPEAADGDVWLDLVAIPEGTWLVERPVAGSATSAWHCAICDSRTLSALTWRHAVGLAPTNLPVTVAHDPSDVVGRVDRVFYERGTGVVARVQVRRSFYDRPGATTYRVSPDVRCFTTGTNVAIRTDGWIHESQAYWTARAARLEAAAAATTDPGYAARLSAELARIAALTNPPAASAVVTAPIYLRGLSFVRSPMLPTSQVHPAVYGSFTNGYPVRTEWPNPQHTIP